MFNYDYCDDFYKDNYIDFESRDLTIFRDLRVEEVNDALFVPCDFPAPPHRGGVFRNDKKYSELSAFCALMPIDSWGEPEYPDNDDSIEYIDEEVIYFGCFWKQWGHFLMDHISRLWYWVHYRPNMRLVYCADENVEITGVYLSFLEYLGISKESLIRITKPTKFKKIIIPECSYQPGIYYHPYFKELFDIVAERAINGLDKSILEKYKEKNIYFSRKNLGGRLKNEIGLNDLEKLFEKSGFLVISPEKYSLAEQIAMIRLSNTVACLSGTLGHTMMFANDGAKFIHIRKTFKYNYRQFDVHHIRNLNVTTIDAHISLKPVGAPGPYIIDINKNVRSFFKNSMCLKVSNFKYWFKRKIYMPWFLLLNLYRNRGQKYSISVWKDENLNSDKHYQRKMFNYYFKRVLK